jgi:hypothetical protein
MFCFIVAIRLAPTSMDYWMSKRDLLIQIGDKKREMECYQRMLPVLPLDSKEYYMEIVRKLTVVCLCYIRT